MGIKFRGIRGFRPKAPKSDHFHTYRGYTRNSHLRFYPGVNNNIFPGKFSGSDFYKNPFPTGVLNNSVFYGARLRFTLRSSQNWTDRVLAPGEPVAPHLGMGETFQLDPNNIPYTQLGRYRCANTPAKTLVGDRACYSRGSGNTLTNSKPPIRHVLLPGGF